MQFTGPARVVNSDATVLLVFRADVVHTGTYTVGEGLTFSGGAVGVCTSYSPGLISYVIPGDVKPLPDEDVDGDTSLVSTTINSLDLDQSLINFGIDDGDFFIRSGDHVGYTVGDVPTAWRLELTAPYVGVSSLEADIILHNSRTSLGLFLYDRRDRETASLNNEDNRLLDSLILGGVGNSGIPAGRLTLSSGTPVTTAEVSGASTVYYSPYVGNLISIYDGSVWLRYEFSELSQSTSDATKSPAAVANNSNYDMFVWSDDGTLRCTRGPAWTSATARGTGAGTTELESLIGRLVNKVDITNGPVAQRGTYVGTIRSDGSAQVNDTLRLRMVWNAFNRVVRAMQRFETTNSWTYSTAAYQQTNADATNQLEFVRGLDADAVRCDAVGLAQNSTSTPRVVVTGIGLDSITDKTGIAIRGTVTDTFLMGSHAIFNGLPGLGYHYLSWLEFGGASDTQTWYGDAGATLQQTGIVATVLA